LAFVVGAEKGYLVSVKRDTDEPFTGLFSFSRTCTYDRCTVSWRDEVSSLGVTRSNVFLCPCCGSMFLKVGLVWRGPAEAPLRRAFRMSERHDGDLAIAYREQPLLTLP
jgi:Rieske Fe-S protein